MAADTNRTASRTTTQNITIRPCCPESFYEQKAQNALFGHGELFRSLLAAGQVDSLRWRWSRFCSAAECRCCRHPRTAASANDAHHHRVGGPHPRVLKLRLPVPARRLYLARGIWGSHLRS